MVKSIVKCRMKLLFHSQTSIVEVWEWISNFISHFAARLITDSCCYQINQWCIDVVKIIARLYYLFRNNINKHGTQFSYFQPMNPFSIESRPLSDLYKWLLYCVQKYWTSVVCWWHQPVSSGSNAITLQDRINNDNTVMSQSARWHLKSPASRLFYLTVYSGADKKKT